jgi:long-chain acyl-CoA synthetase
VVRDSSAADRDDEVLRRELLAWGREHLAGHKYPRRVDFVDSMPLGPSGKVLKRELVAAYRE